MSKAKRPSTWQNWVTDSILWIAVTCIVLGAGAWLSLLDR